ncbi:MAG TPA: hypothetical protein PLB63_09025 [Planctomycetota bacterium]|nr:hypothetical protein [Planctomycetota bacterium]HQB01145.1 hypothetical protein [Planctomycetota bacterium]
MVLCYIKDNNKSKLDAVQKEIKKLEKELAAVQPTKTACRKIQNPKTRFDAKNAQWHLAYQTRNH